MDRRRFGWVAGFVVAAPLTMTAAGLLALALTPSYLLTSSPGGIPRWIPLGVSVVLAVVAIYCAGVRILPFAALAAFWAFGSAAFCRPALRDLAGTDWRLEPVILALAVVLALMARRRDAGKPLQRALVSAPALVLILTAVVCFPVVPAKDSGAYVLTLAVAFFSVRAAAVQRRATR